MTATTSPHGSQSAGKADWSPLAGKQVVILPDNDDPGEKYANDVAKILLRMTPQPTVTIIQLPGLPEGGDIVDWLELQTSSSERDELKRQIEQLAEGTTPMIKKWTYLKST